MSRALHAAAALVLAVGFGLAGVGSLLASTAVRSAPQSTAPQATSYLEGVDISNWQGTIDWAQVAAAGKSFAIAKVSEGETYKDPYWPANHANAKANGLRIGGYHFAQPGNPSSEAIIQADWFVRNLAAVAGDVVPTLDLEVTNGLGVTDLQNWVLAFLQEVEAKTGAKAMIYVSPSFWSTYMGNTTMFADMGYNILWIAHWGVANPTVPASNWGGKGWTFWQYSNCGSVPGIGGCVDLDRFNGTDMTRVLFGPGVPTAVTGVAGNQQVAVSWAAPASSSGGALTGYTVTAAPGGARCTATGATSCTVTGLSNGTPYTFSVTATNASGTGQASTASPAVTPRTVPDAPAAPTASPGNQQAQVSWTPPAWNGGATISGYTVTSAPGGKTCTTTGATSCTVSGLANGTTYTFIVTATNVAGTSAASSASSAVTPRTVPDAPTGAAATPGDAFAAVSWVAPAWNGGAPISGYTVTASPGGSTCTTTGALTCSVLGLTNGTPYTFAVTATNAAGVSASSAATGTTPWPPIASTYVPIKPTRILDTRAGTGLSGSLVAGTPRTFTVAGLAGVPANAVGVTGILTVTQQTARGWVYLGPIATTAATSSTINFPFGDDRANGVTVALGPGGSLSALYGAAAGATVQLVFDVTGYFTPDLSGATYVPVAPVRLVDTRSGTGLSGPLQAGVPRTVQITGRGGVPATAVAVTATVTVTQQTKGGWVYVGSGPWEAGSGSTINFPVQDDRANGITVPLAADGSLSATYGAPTGNTTALLVDITGYFVPGSSGAAYVPLSPTRILDTRLGLGLSGPFAATSPRTYQVAGTGGVPQTAVGVTANATVTGQTAGGWFFAGPVATSSPASSTINFPTGDDRATGVSLGMGSGGTLSGVLGAVAGSSVHLVVDVTGYWVPPTP